MARRTTRAFRRSGQRGLQRQQRLWASRDSLVRKWSPPAATLPYKAPIPFTAASEADAAVSIARRHVKALGTAVEADAAMPLVEIKRRTLGVATTSDTSILATKSKRDALAFATEVDQSRPITSANITVAILVAVESDAAMPITPVRIRRVDGQTASFTMTAGVGTVVIPPPVLVSATRRSRISFNA